MSLKATEKRLARCLKILDGCSSLDSKINNQHFLSESNFKILLSQLREAIKEIVLHECEASLMPSDSLFETLAINEQNEDDEDNKPLLRTRKTRKRKHVQYSEGEPDEDDHLIDAKNRRISSSSSQNVSHSMYTVSKELKSLLLWVNDLPPCYHKDVLPLPADFDVLRGKKFDFYGLHSLNSWRQELVLLLLRFPHFRHNNFLFFAQIFQQTAQIWRQKLTSYDKLLNNDHMGKHSWKYCCKEKSFLQKVLNPILEGNVDYGLDELDLQKLEAAKLKVEGLEGKVVEEAGVLDELTGELRLSENKPSASALLEELKNEQHQPKPASFLRHQMVLSGKCINVKVEKTFGTMQYYGYKRFVIPELKTRNCIGLLAIRARPKKSKARIVVNHFAFETSDPRSEIMQVVELLTKVFGMSKKSVFRWKEMVPKGEGYAYRKYQPKDIRTALLNSPVEIRREKLSQAIRDFQPYEERLKHNSVKELNSNSKDDSSSCHHELEVVSQLDWKEVNNVSVLFCREEGNYSVKTLFDNDCLEKFIREADTCKTHTSQKLNHSQFCRTILEVFKFLTNVESKDMVNRFPEFGAEFRTIRNKFNVLQDLQDMQDTINKQCNYCGKVFECHTTTMDGQSISLHIKKCKLEKANCECGLTFASPREKRHHMLFKHSGKSYLECTQCHYLTQKQDALDNHVEYFHGFPGREETCDLCYKNFRSRYHLSIHMFTHECYWCHECQREFLGRLPFRNHMKNDHGAGHPCEQCGKVMATKVELNKHKKLNHADKTWMSS